MCERLSSSNSVLITEVPNLVDEAFNYDPDLAKPSDIVINTDEDGFISEIFDSRPTGDLDKNGWLFLLGSSYLGYFVQQKLYYGRSIAPGIFINALQSQLANDSQRWGDTWKKQKIEGQLEFLYSRFDEYNKNYQKENEEFPWLKVAGGIIINLYRLEHPDYQK